MPKKQVAALAQLIFVLFFVSVFFFVRSLDSGRYQQDLIALGALQLLGSRAEAALMPDLDANASMLHKALYDSLAEQHPEIQDYLRDAANDIDRAIRKDYGEGWSEQSGRGFFASLLALPPSLGYVDRPLHAKLGEISRLYASAGGGTVNSNLVALDELTVVSVRVPENMNYEPEDRAFTALQSVKGRDRSNGPFTLYSSNYILDVGMVDGYLTLELASQQRTSQSDAAGTEASFDPDRPWWPNPHEISIPATFREVKVDLARHLMQGTDAELLKLLRERRHRLADRYGTILVSHASSVTERHSLLMYDHVEMLGFDFSPEVLWFFVWCTLLLLQACTLIHMHSGATDEGLTTFGLSAVIGIRDFQFVVWIVVPIATLCFAHPLPWKPMQEDLWFWASLIPVGGFGAFLLRSAP